MPQIDQTRARQDVLNRIRGLRLLLDSVEARVQDPACPLNPLGELQGEPVKLDCAIAVLAQLRQLDTELAAFRSSQ